jgi:outer membrane receptor protein involved in Fe transport
MRNYLLLFLLFISSFVYAPAYAQRPQGNGNFNPQNAPAIGKITGKLIDKQTKQPLEFATIALYRIPRNQGGIKKDTILFETGTTSNDKGEFILEQVKVGRFMVKIDFIGYKTFKSDTFMITPKNPEMIFDKLEVSSNEQQLASVEIIGEKAVYEQQLDKKVFNVEKNITATGGTVNDVLQNIPSVSVDIDGNVSMRGSGNVTILIDGKPSGLTGANRAAALAQLPAAMVDKIEIITNPSARYDADGMSGIINIVTKKNKLEGMNGNISAGVGTRNKYNIGTNLSYKIKKINFFGNYSYRHDQRFSNGYSLRKNTINDSIWHSDQYNNGLRIPYFHIAKIGLDYYLSNNTTISTNVNYSYRIDGETDNFTYNIGDKFNNPLYNYHRNTSGRENGNNWDYTLNFKHSFPKNKSELTADVVYSTADNTVTSNFSTEKQAYKYSKYDSLQNTNNISGVKILTLQTDFTLPIGKTKKGKFEAGYKSILRTIDNNFLSNSFDWEKSLYQRDSRLNNDFRYNENIHAAYVMMGNEFKGFQWQAGLRAEQTFTKSEVLTTGESYPNQYFNVFPSLVINKQLKGENELVLSFSRRLNRPQVGTLNPFVDYSDPLNLRKGNPSLLPEYINSFEFSYNKNWKSYSINSTVYYRTIEGVITRYRTVDNGGIATTTFKNLTSGTSYGLELVGRLQPFNWWDITISGNVFQSIINGTNVDASLNNNNLSWNARFISNNKISKTLSTQIIANYNAPNVMPQGMTIPIYGIDLAIKKDIFKGKGTLTLNVSDIFDWRRFGATLSDATFYNQFTRKRESQVATLNFSYRFGSKDFAPSRRKASKGNEGGLEGGGGGDF